MTHGLGKLLAVVGASALLACGKSPDAGGAPSKSWVEPDLAPLASCGDTEDSVRSALITWMNRRIDENIESFLSDAGGSCDDVEAMAAGTPGMPTAPTQPSSGTNNQVPGVEEADFVKNDAEHVYVVANGAFSIVDVSLPEQAHEVSRVPLEGKPKKLLLVGDRVVVLSALPKPESSTEPYDPYDPYGGFGAPAYYEEPSDCTYGYDCEFVGDGHPTRLSVFDVTDRKKPTLVRELDLSSSLISARSVGSGIHVVVHHSTNYVLSQLDLWPDELNECGNFSPITGVVAFEALRAKNVELIDSALASGLLPKLTDKRITNGEDQTTDLTAGCAGFYRSPLGDGDGFVTLLSFDAATNEAVSASTIVSRPGAVYVTPESLYMAVRQYAQQNGPWFSSSPSASQVTALHKFTLGSGAQTSTYVASGLVRGGVLNQFSMDDWGGHLRVATTSGLGSSDGNRVSVLEQDGARLTVVGEVSGIAPQEDIRAVRFDGARGFVVTFRQTDPLHVLDLSDPRAPRQAGELVVPGFSTYLHMMDGDHLLGIGMEGNGGMTSGGVKLSMYDVSNLDEPAELYTENMSFASASAAVTDHLAFSYVAGLQILAVPYADCSSWSTGNASGLAVYDVSPAEGFSLRGTLPFPASSTSSSYMGAECGDWWAKSTSRVKRSIVFGNHLVALSDDLLQVASLDAVSEAVASVPLDGSSQP